MTNKDIETLNTLHYITKILSDIERDLFIQNILLQKLIQNDGDKDQEKE